MSEHMLLFSFAHARITDAMDQTAMTVFNDQQRAGGISYHFNEVQFTRAYQCQDNHIGQTLLGP